jgi:hypothetical protein
MFDYFQTSSHALNPKLHIFKVLSQFKKFFWTHCTKKLVSLIFQTLLNDLNLKLHTYLMLILGFFWHVLKF